MRKLTHGKRVTVEILDQRSPESIVGRVTVDGKDLAVTLIEAGLAWAVEDSPAELRVAQDQAKSAALGLCERDTDAAVGVPQQGVTAAC